MRTAIFLGLILIASAIEAQGNGVDWSEIAIIGIATLIIVYNVIDIIIFNKKLRNRK